MSGRCSPTCVATGRVLGGALSSSFVGFRVHPLVVFLLKRLLTTLLVYIVPFYSLSYIYILPVKKKKLTTPA